MVPCKYGQMYYFYVRSRNFGALFVMLLLLGLKNKTYLKVILFYIYT